MERDQNDGWRLVRQLTAAGCATLSVFAGWAGGAHAGCPGGCQGLPYYDAQPIAPPAYAAPHWDYRSDTAEGGAAPTPPAETQSTGPAVAPEYAAPDGTFNGSISPSPTDFGGLDLGAGDGAMPPSRPQGAPSGLGAVAASESASIHMIGDFFSSGYFLGDTMAIASVPAAGGDRRFKAADGLSPLPQDRVFFNYHHFHNAVVDIDSADVSVDRFTFGLERTFLDQMMSVEVRVPFAGGLNATQTYDATRRGTEFGNMTLSVKGRLFARGPWIASGGLAIVLPTAGDASVDSGSQTAVLDNEAVHLQPYFGLTRVDPCSRWFTQAYLAVDFDANGNPLSVVDEFGLYGPAVTRLGRAYDQSLLFVDWQIGYWLYQDYGHIGWLNGIAPVLELHYTDSLDEAQEFSVLSAPFGDVQLLNLTAGLMFDFRKQATLTVYGAAPLKRDSAEVFGRTVTPVFDAEFGVQCACRY